MMELAQKECFIFDLDGTVYMGEEPIQGTIDFILNNLDKKSIYFMTNNTSKTPDEYIRRLKKFNISINENQIISPFIPLLAYLKENKLTKIYLLANDKVTFYIKTCFPEISFSDSYKDCEAIVVTFDTDLTYEKLKTASLLLQNNEQIRFVATHPDNVCPTNEGNIPDVGAFNTLFEITTGRKPEKIFGKPNTDLLHDILKSHTKEKCVVVGDRLYTDKKLADNAGIDFICVLSGEATREEAESQEKKPALIINDLGHFNN